MTLASIIVPAFNVEATLTCTLNALLEQTYQKFEIIIVDDGSTDATNRIATGFSGDPRVRVIRQANRGLAGARNTGIAAARGDIIGFCDADDLWVPEKLARHVVHFEARPEVGISFSGSALIDDDGNLTGQAQRPQLTGITEVNIFKRNPIGNGSATMIRREVLEEIAYHHRQEPTRHWYFDETFRQSEDIECWMRIALTTNWVFEGIPGLLTQYRISTGGLSAATDRQLAAWERMVQKQTPLNPAFFEVNAPAARAYQLRYLSRRAISDLDGGRAIELTKAWLAESRLPLFEEPIKSIVTLGASAALFAFGKRALQTVMMFAQRARTAGRT
ncbi:glycosyltransferase family 2 protein [Paracoccus tegillarcae]|uniref:Glucosyl transferase n=1 Tax=Paracoccus tegillarcae TaxID=1529068 RepID=A0A2K9EDM7_9RHOB|nr:glycosyltransferase family 2 protein [Paracoccus tegillarcae]AUH33058.1 glucosyl transferase [Paracoccus tegillarcae]